MDLAATVADPQRVTPLRSVGGTTTSSKREAARLHERLTRVQAAYRRVLATKRELEEQVSFLTGVADDAETRRLVAETPLAEREWRQAKTDLERHRVLLRESRTELEQLAAQRDQLLDRLLDT